MVEICCLSLIRNLWVKTKEKGKTIRHSSNSSKQLQENGRTNGLEESDLPKGSPKCIEKDIL